MATTRQTLSDLASDEMSTLIQSGASSYSIGNRTVTKIPLKDLLEVFDRLEHSADRKANGILRVAKLQKRSS